MCIRDRDVGDTDEELREAFKVFDKEGTGVITRQDLKQIMLHLGETLTEEEAEALVKEAELDGEGHINYEGMSVFIFTSLSKLLVFTHIGMGHCL